MRPYGRLADNEFEDLVGDLLGEERGHRYERFARGADLGIDLRYSAPPLLEIIQCKHYSNSSISQLRAQARREAARLAELNPQPTTYKFVTSRRLTLANKLELAKIFSQWMSDPRDILSGSDIDALLDRHPFVERRHVKLWLAGGTALQALLNADVLNQTGALLSAINRALPLYVQTDAFLRAHDRLGKERICIISGRPGIGKTMLARMLIADVITQGYEPIEISYDIAEAWWVWDCSVPQAFYYDDFLGTTTLGELNKNEDQRLIAFMSEVVSRSNACFVLTTREYILKQALDIYESFERFDLDARKFILTLGHYQYFERAKILYNHVFHSKRLPLVARTSLGISDGYEKIVMSPLFNPRLIEAITDGYGDAEVTEGVGFVDFAVAVFGDPERLWRRAFEAQISPREHVLLYTLVSMPEGAVISDISKAAGPLAEGLGVPVGIDSVERALGVLDNSFVETDIEMGENIVEFLTPSAEDFVNGRIRQSTELQSALIGSAVFFDQLRGVARILEGKATTSTNILLATKAVSLFDTESLVWRRYESPGTEGRIRIREQLVPEARLEFILGLIASESESDVESVLSFVSKQIEALVDSWEAGTIPDPSVIQLTARLCAKESVLRPPNRYFAVLRAALVACARLPSHYRQLFALHKTAPEAFEASQIDEVSIALAASSREYLEKMGGERPYSDEECDSLLEIAEKADMAIDSLFRIVGEERLRSERVEKRDDHWEGIEDEERKSQGDLRDYREDAHRLFMRLNEP